MKKPINPTIGAHLPRGGFYLLLPLIFCIMSFARAQQNTSTGVKARIHRSDHSPSTTSGDVYQAWVTHYNGPGNDFDEPVALAIDDSGNIYVAGYSLGSGTIVDYATVKYNPAGQQEWVARYNGPDNGDDWLHAMTIDGSGNVYVTGLSNTADSYADCTTIKYNSSGQEQWVARHNVCPRAYAWGVALAVDDLGDVYVTGVDGVGWATIKYNLSGEEEWIAYRAQDGPTTHGIALDKAGNVYVTGGASDYITIKYDSSGQEQWISSYNGTGNADDRATAIAIDGLGNVYVTGSSDLPGTYYQYSTVKYNAAGQQQWVGIYGESGGVSGATAIALDSSNIYVTGSIAHEGMYPDYGTIKYNSAGQQQWVARYNGPPQNAFDVATAIAVDGSGDIYVTGRSQPTSFFGDYDYVTIKYNSAGQEQWLSRYDGFGNSNDEAIAIAIGAPGNVYVTGRSGTFSYDYTTVKYGQGPTPTPTATATGSPTPTSTATPTATATASPTPTAMCSPTPMATASPTPTPSSPGSPPPTPPEPSPTPTPSEPPHPTPTVTPTPTLTPPMTPSPTATGTPTRRPTPRPRPTLPPRP